MMSPGTDYYRELGVAKGAGADEIRAAYRKLARKYHPDHNPDDAAAEERFKAVGEAYAVLSDENKRRLYDKFGDDGLREGFDEAAYERMRSGFGGGYGGGAPGGFSFDFGGAQGVDLGDLFGGAFGGGGRASQSGKDLNLTLRASFEQAAAGFQTSFTFRRPSRCRVCSGRGGVGNSICASCGGRGLTEETKTLTVNVPAGADDGDTLRLKGKGGEPRNGGQRGDVVLTIQVEEHPTLKREGRNLIARAEVTPLDLLTGTTVEVPTLDGAIRMKVPAGADPAVRLRAGGKGIVRKGKAGDLQVELVVVPLAATSPSVQAAIDNLADAVRSEAT